VQPAPTALQEWFSGLPLPRDVAGPVYASIDYPDYTASGDVVGMANFMREYGTRLYNAEKNTGTARFAFNYLQRMLFPPEYQCPPSVAGGTQT
jgi:hypothetical protein